MLLCLRIEGDAHGVHDAETRGCRLALRGMNVWCGAKLESEVE
jgi:hypothetical protein